MTSKADGLLGMAMRAGKVVSGEVSVETAIKSGKAYLVIVAEDASDNTKKKFRNSAAFYEVPFLEFRTKTQLGHILGKEYRSSVAITDEGFAKAFQQKLEK